MFVKLNKRINKLNSVMGQIDDFISALILYNISNKYDISDKMDKTIEIIKTCQETYLIYIKHESVINQILENIIDKKRQPTRTEAARIIRYLKKLRKKILKKIRKLDSEMKYFHKFHKKNKIFD